MMILPIKTQSQNEFIDVTAQVRRVVQQSGIMTGLCCLYVPHTTAGVTINENADPCVQADILMMLDRLAPLAAGYRHMEGNSAAHVKSTLTGVSQNILIRNQDLVLGTWQGIFFCEFDGPRARKLHIELLKG